uniref:Uncharacterized protein n=1 Tax=viral metagenome TaxID=1070528 RepID=A0A6C0KN41_9ZZZZ
MSKRNDKIKNNKEKDITVRNKAIISNYMLQIKKDSSYFPKTEIIEYIIKNYQEDLIKEYELNDIFAMPSDLFLPEKVFNISSNFQKKSEMSLDKLLAYSLYITNSSIFKQNKGYSYFDTQFKRQIYMDILRTVIYLNNNLLPKDQIIVEDDYNKTVNNFNLFIMKTMENNKTLIKMNTVLKIDLLMCQNIINFFSNALIIFVNNKVNPEFSNQTSVNKDISLFLTDKEQYILINYRCKIIITYDNELNPEYDCGNCNLSLKIDLKNDTYSLENFNLNYNVDNCIPPYYQNNIINSEESRLSKFKKDASKFKKDASKFVSNNKGTIAAGVASTGLISVGALYLAGILGGKTKKKNFKRKKTKKNNFKYKKTKTKTKTKTKNL